MICDLLSAFKEAETGVSVYSFSGDLRLVSTIIDMITGRGQFDDAECSRLPAGIN